MSSNTVVISNAYVVLTFLFRQEDGGWVGVCKELGTAADGDSLEEARRTLEDYVLCHLNALETVGERERFFEDHGVEIHVDQVPVRRVGVDVDPETLATAFVHSLRESANC